MKMDCRVPSVVLLGGMSGIPRTPLTTPSLMSPPSPSLSTPSTLSTLQRLVLSSVWGKTEILGVINVCFGVSENKGWRDKEMKKGVCNFHWFIPLICIFVFISLFCQFLFSLTDLQKCEANECCYYFYKYYYYYHQTFLFTQFSVLYIFVLNYNFLYYYSWETNISTGSEWWRVCPWQLCRARNTNSAL